MKGKSHTIVSAIAPFKQKGCRVDLNKGEIKVPKQLTLGIKMQGKVDFLVKEGFQFIHESNTQP